MNFTKRKIAASEVSELRLCPIESIKPYALMLAPIYILLKQNQKFVSLKAPMDFFTPAELNKFSVLESFFISEFIDKVKPYRDAGRKLRALLKWKPNKEGVLPPAPFEISDAVIRILGPLWGVGFKLEPFFVTALVNEICDLLPGEALEKSREKSVPLFEHALHKSAWVVFMALHLGITDLSILNKLRLEAFIAASVEKRLVDGSFARQPQNIYGSDLNELLGFVETVMPLGFSVPRFVEIRSQIEGERRVNLKLKSRIRRIEHDLISEDFEVPSLYGEGGIIFDQTPS